MPFLPSLTRPSSPTHQMHSGTSSANNMANTAGQSVQSPASPPVPRGHIDLDMGISDISERPKVEIILDQHPVFLKGTGVDVEPARLSGFVLLSLSESTSIKEVSLSFRGKARLPVPTVETMALQGASSLTYILCEHDWSFLEGQKKHSHTLKAGRHFFPFQLQLGGSLPSSVATDASGGASVQYKLRAYVVRSSALSHNLQAVEPVIIIRSFAEAALEYSSTLEIENTWPQKLMYAVMLPHKAWAIGDKLTALATFSPLTKGTRVISVTTTITETTKIFARSGLQEQCRTAVIAKHRLVDGKAIQIIGQKEPKPNSSAPSSPEHMHTGSRTDGPSGSYFPFHPPHTSGSAHPPEPYALSSSTTTTTDGLAEASADEEEQSADVVVQLALDLPLSLTPTHSLQPIIVSHRIRWSILIANPDGHTSELRCSLPLHILDSRLLSEARLHTATTRRLLLGGPEVPNPENLEAEEELELPSYNSHIRDRVANMFLPEAVTMRVMQDFDSTLPGTDQFLPRAYSGTATPAETLTHSPGGLHTSLDWVNSELMLTLPDTSSPLDAHNAIPSSQFDIPRSTNTSPSESLLPSRRPSRPPSPDHGHNKRHYKPGTNESYVHEHNHASLSLNSVLSTSMKPFSHLTHPHWPMSRSQSHSNVPTRSTPSAHDSSRRSGATTNPSHSSTTPSVTSPHPAHADSHSGYINRALDEVPDYDIAARGLVPPLSSIRGLPSYEETERSQPLRPNVSESDVAAQFSRLRMPRGTDMVVI